MLGFGIVVEDDRLGRRAAAEQAHLRLMGVARGFVEQLQDGCFDAIFDP